MSVNESLMASGSWSLRLRPNAPQSILDKISFFSHLAITEGREDVRITGDALLSSARYVGVLRGQEKENDGTTLSGAGMAIWLGDEDDKGLVYETPRTFTGQSFTATITALLTGSAVLPGTISSVTGTYTGTHQYQTPRKAIDYVCSTMGAEWRVNGNGTLDAGEVDDLYPTEPRAGVFSKARGTSSSVRALPGTAKTASDTEDFTTRVVLLANQEETTIATGAASINPETNPYRDVHGNPVQMTRMVSESGTATANATVRAQLQLNRFTGTRDAVTLNSTTHDVAGYLAVGEKVWVFDPDAGLYDNNNELTWQGENLNPLLLRVTALTWPIEQGRGVYLRTKDGEWLDLSDYFIPESGQTNVTVGGYSRSLTSTGSEPVGIRTSVVPKPNTTVPAAPTWQTPFLQSVYQSPKTGQTRAQVQLDWNVPLNTDGSAIIDGDYYEIRYRTTTELFYPATHAQMAGYSHDELVTHAEPIPVVVGGWSYQRVSFDQSLFLLSELTPGVNYEFQVRAADNGTPANYGDWSASALVTSAADTIAPETPAPPVVAGNPLAIMVRHDLGRAEGGTFNLALDLNHLEIHADLVPGFTPIPRQPHLGGTMLGKLMAGDALLNGKIPAVGSFSLQNTGAVHVKVVAVDNAGNRSAPSTAVEATAQLVDDAYITNLSATKITAGTLLAQYVVAGAIGTSFATGVDRAFMTDDGFLAYDANDDLTFWAGTNGQTYMKGRFVTGEVGQRRITIDPADQAMRFFPNGTNQRFKISSFSVDQPEDMSDAPGLVLQGYNEQGLEAGGRFILTEEAWGLSLEQDTGTEQFGGNIWGNIATAHIGMRTGGFAQFQQTNWRLGIESGAGGRIYADEGVMILTNGRIGGGDEPYIYFESNRTDIRLHPSGSGHGYLDFTSDAGSVGNSARLKFMTAEGYGDMWKVWNNQGGSVNMECRNWQDTAFAAVVGSQFINGSDESTKTNIADLTTSALAKVKGTKVKKYRRRGGSQGSADVWDLDTPAESKDKKAPRRRLLSPATPEADGAEEIGLIAQDVQILAPEIVVETSGGLGVSQYGMTSLIWKATQELADENDAFRSELAALTAVVNKLSTKKG